MAVGEVAMLSSRLTWGPSSGFLYSLFYSGLLIMYQYCYVCMKVRHTEEFGTRKGVLCTSSSIQIWNKTWMWAAVSDREQQRCHGPGFSFSSRLGWRDCFLVMTNPQASNITGNGVCPWFFVSRSNGTPPPHQPPRKVRDPGRKLVSVELQTAHKPSDTQWRGSRDVLH